MMNIYIFLGERIAIFVCLADFFIRFFHVSNINQAGRYLVTKDVPSGETIQAMLVTRVKREGTDKEIGKERLDAPGCPTLSISVVWVACRTSQIPLLFVTHTALMNAGMVSVTSPLEKGSVEDRRPECSF